MTKRHENDISSFAEVWAYPRFEMWQVWGQFSGRRPGGRSLRSGSTNGRKPGCATPLKFFYFY